LFEDLIKQNIVDNNIHNEQNDNTFTGNTRRSTTIIRLLVFLSDCHHNVSRVINIRSVKYHIPDVIDYNKLSQKHLRYSLALNVNFEPKYYDEVDKSSKRCEATDKKFKPLNIIILGS